MSSKKDKSKSKKRDKKEGSDNEEQGEKIPQWATVQIKPIDDPFHDDFEVPIVLEKK